VLLVIGPVALVARRRQAAEPGRGRLTRKRSLGGALLPGRRLRTPAGGGGRGTGPWPSQTMPQISALVVVTGQPANVSGRTCLSLVNSAG